jgi:hypothetical protein
MVVMTNKKYSIILNKKLKQMPSGIAMNVVAHIGAQLGTINPEIKGTALPDISGDLHSGIPIYPNAILYTKGIHLKKLFKETLLKKEIILIDYPEGGSNTADDEEFCKFISNQKEEDIEYWGIALYGDTEIVNNMTKKCNFWKYNFEQDRRRQ